MSPGSTLPGGEVDPMDISMILSSGAFNLQDGALAQMDISMTLQKGNSISPTSRRYLLIIPDKSHYRHYRR